MAPSNTVYQGTGTRSFSSAELGFPGPPAPPPGDLPPGDGGLTVSNFLSFSALVTNASRSYLYSSDEALLNSWQNARAMRRDAVLWAALRERQRKTVHLSWHITPHDETDPAESEAAQLITKCVEAIPRFNQMKRQLLEALWYGKYATEIAWAWRDDIVPGQTLLGVRRHIPINGDKIRFKWDGTPGVLVYAGYPGTWEATDWGMAHFLTPSEREQYIIHEFEPDDADYMEPQLAGGIHGVGLRGRLYWFWWLKQQVFGLLMNYLQRFSNGLTIFYYNAHDPQSKTEAIAAAQAQFSQTALIYPRWSKDMKSPDGVERLEVGTASPALLQSLVTEYFDVVMIRAIRGESLYTGPEGGARGGGDVAELEDSAFDEVIKYDAIDLQETLQSDLINVLYKYNAPGVRPGKFEFQVDDPNSAEMMSYGNILYQWGVPLDEDEAYKFSKWSKPRSGSGIISKLGPMQPAAIGAPPQGVPVVGQPGADPATEIAMQQQATPAALPPSANGAPVAFRRNGKPPIKQAKSLPTRRLSISRV